MAPAPAGKKSDADLLPETCPAWIIVPVMVRFGKVFKHLGLELLSE
jgi:hypothetical protein